MNAIMHDLREGGGIFGFERAVFHGLRVPRDGRVKKLAMEMQNAAPKGDARKA